MKLVARLVLALVFTLSCATLTTAGERVQAQNQPGPSDPGGINNPLMPDSTNCSWSSGFGWVCSGSSSTAPSSRCCGESYDSQLGVWYCTCYTS